LQAAPPQQSLPTLHGWPVFAQVHFWKAQVPLQQPPGCTQSAPGALQEHMPPMQAPTQQSASTAQVCPDGKQQRPVSMLTKQICAPGQPARQSTLLCPEPQAISTSAKREMSRTVSAYHVGGVIA
jgi:hypothetical protein